MTEDSGAFKTKSAHSRQIPAFVMIRQRRCTQASPAAETTIKRESGLRATHF